MKSLSHIWITSRFSFDKIRLEEEQSLEEAMGVKS